MSLFIGRWLKEDEISDALAVGFGIIGGLDPLWDLWSAKLLVDLLYFIS
jgi:hypothetical protein